MAVVHENRPEYPAPEGDFDRELDERQNESTRLPSGEDVQRRVLQVSECYVGGDLDRLVEGCKALNIEPDNPFGGPDIYEWADSVRRTSSTGGWVVAASLYRQGTERKWMDDIAADLPEDFDRVRLKAMSPIPSVVVLLATFTLSYESANALNDELNTNRYLRIDTRRQRSSSPHCVSSQASSDCARTHACSRSGKPVGCPRLPWHDDRRLQKVIAACD